MKTVKILGTGCAKCKQTERVIVDMIAENNLDVEVIKVEDIQDIMGYNVLSTPAVVVDEIVKIKGHVPSRKELETILLN